MIDVVMSTGFKEIDSCTGGFRRHTSTLILAPSGFGKTEYAHYLVESCNHQEIVSAVFTSKPEDLPEIETYTDYLVNVSALDFDDARMEFDNLAVCPALVVIDNVTNELEGALMKHIRNYSTVVVFSNLELAYRQLHDLHTASEVVLQGICDRSGQKMWLLAKNRYGGAGIMEPIDKRIRGEWQS